MEGEDGLGEGGSGWGGNGLGGGGSGDGGMEMYLNNEKKRYSVIMSQSFCVLKGHSFQVRGWVAQRLVNIHFLHIPTELNHIHKTFSSILIPCFIVLLCVCDRIPLQISDVQTSSTIPR